MKKKLCARRKRKFDVNLIQDSKKELKKFKLTKEIVAAEDAALFNQDIDQLSLAQDNNIVVQQIKTEIIKKNRSIETVDLTRKLLTYGTMTSVLDHVCDTNCIFTPVTKYPPGIHAFTEEHVKTGCVSCCDSSGIYHTCVIGMCRHIHPLRGTFICTLTSYIHDTTICAAGKDAWDGKEIPVAAQNAVAYNMLMYQVEPVSTAKKLKRTSVNSDNTLLLKKRQYVRDIMQILIEVIAKNKLPNNAFITKYVDKILAFWNAVILNNSKVKMATNQFNKYTLAVFYTCFVDGFSVSPSLDSCVEGGEKFMRVAIHKDNHIELQQLLPPLDSIPKQGKYPIGTRHINLKMKMLREGANMIRNKLRIYVDDMYKRSFIRNRFVPLVYNYGIDDIKKMM